MKTIFTIIFLNLFLILDAQPEITSSANPQIGDIILAKTGVEDNTINAGDSGANVNWDFSNVEEDPSIPGIEFTFVAADETAQFDVFPEANLALVAVDTSDSQSISYYDANSDQLVGLGFYAPTLTNIYDDTHVFFDYPLGFGGGFEDDASSSYEVSGFMNFSTVSDKVEADAYGSITTPDGTSNNVLRVKRSSTRIDSFSIMPDNYTITTINSVSYSWLKESAVSAVATLTITSGESVSVIPNLDPIVTPIAESRSFSWSDPQTTSVSEQGFSDVDDLEINLYNLNLDQFVVELNSNVNINGLIKVYDVFGKAIIENSVDINVGKNELDLDLTNFASGNYIMSLELEGQITSKVFNKI